MIKKVKKQFQAPKGTFDILPEDQKYWDKVRKVVKHVALGYGFERIDTPIIESADLYNTGLGAATDVIEKEMYTFRSKGKDMLSLRPEGTAGAVRAYIQNGMAHMPSPIKLYYIGQMFRYEQPQAGRYRQHHQVGFEVFGEKDAVYDAQIIALFMASIHDLGIRNLQVEINSLGCAECRPAFRTQLLRYYRARVTRVCKDCRRRIKENPLRLLDCKEEKCQQIKTYAPSLMDHLCAECRTHFKSVFEYLDELEIPYALNPHLVRGLDYYTKTVFEIFLEDEHVQGGDEKHHKRSKLALGGGGRYNHLIKTLGGKDAPAVGASFGMERIINVMKRQNVKLQPLFKPDVFLVQLGALSKRKCLRLFEELRRAGIAVAEAFGKDSIKTQLRSADKMGVKLSLILGHKEAIDGTIIVREMNSGSQEAVVIENVIKIIKEKLKKI